MKQKRNYETALLEAIQLSSRAQLLSESEEHTITDSTTVGINAMGPVGTLE